MSIEEIYRAERKRLRDRAYLWEKNKGFKYKLPPIPEIITEESVEELRSIRYKELTDIQERQTEYARSKDLTTRDVERYGYSGSPLVTWAEQHPSSVTAEFANKHAEVEPIFRKEYHKDAFSDDGFFEPTEAYWEQGNDKPINTPRDRNNKPIVEENVIDEFISDLKATLSDYKDYLPLRFNWKTGKFYEKTEAKDIEWAERYAEMIRDNIDWAINQHPNKQAFYHYLKDPLITRKLEEAAHRIYADSDPMRVNQRDRSFREIIEILKGAPLTDEEWDEVTQNGTGVYNYDFTTGYNEE